MLLTAYNSEVQRYINEHAIKVASNYVKERMRALEELVYEQCGIFSKLFPRKQREVLDEIIYATSGCGIWKIGADTLAAKVGCGITTVYKAVKSLKATGDFVVARLADDRAGKYIFVDKRHENFADIMREVFRLDSAKIEGLSVGQNVGLESGENVDMAVSNEGNTTSNLYNGFSCLNTQDNNINNINIENNIELVNFDIMKETERMEKYATNPFQQTLFNFIKEMPYPNEIKKVASLIALRIGQDCDSTLFIKAKNALHSMSERISKGYKFDNVVAAFTKALQKRMSYPTIPSAKEPDTPPANEAPELYNWLDEREETLPLFNWLKFR